MRLVLIFIIWIAAFYTGDWKLWKRVYPTILFMIAGNFFVCILTYEYTLWNLSSEIGGHVINDLLLSTLFFPPALLLFFSFYPFDKKMNKQLLFLLLSALVFTGIEWIEFLLNNIHYDHNWNLWKSFLVNTAIFATVRVHYSKPVLAYVMFFIEILLLISITNIPLHQIK